MELDEFLHQSEFFTDPKLKTSSELYLLTALYVESVPVIMFSLVCSYFQSEHREVKSTLLDWVSTRIQRYDTRPTIEYTAMLYTQQYIEGSYLYL